MKSTLMLPRRGCHRLGRHLVVAALLLFLAAAIGGCAAAQGSTTAFLLEQDYLRMTNAQLTAYEQELNDALGRSARSSPSGVSLGVGLGSWGSHSGVGVGVGQTIGGGESGSDAELRDRRDATRDEMRRRGLLP